MPPFRENSQEVCRSSKSVPVTPTVSSTFFDSTVKIVKEQDIEIPKFEEETAEIPISEEETAEIPISEEETAEIPISEDETAEILKSEDKIAEIPESEDKIAEIPESEDETAEISKTNESISKVEAESSEDKLVYQNENQPKQSKIDGEIWPPIFQPECVRSAKKMIPRDDDVFVCTYPKCGTTWIQHIAAQIILKDYTPQAGKELSMTSPMIERMGAEYADSLTSPRLLKTHFNYSNCPKNKNAKYIYCVRNPKDCVTSYYFHNKNFKIYDWENGKFKEFFDMFMESKLAFGDYFEHLKSWLPHIKDKNVLFLKYEDMLADLEDAVKKIAEFLNVELDEESLNKIVTESRIDSMKKNQTRWFPESALRQPTFIRKGTKRDWENHLDFKQSDRVDKKLNKEFEGTEVTKWWTDEMFWKDPTKASEKAPENVAEKTVEKLTEKAPEKNLKKVPEKTVTKVPEKKLEDISEKLPKMIVTKVPEKKLEDISEKVPEKIVTKVPETKLEDISRKVAEMILEKNSKKPDKLHEQFLKRFAESIIETTSEQIPDIEVTFSDPTAPTQSSEDEGYDDLEPDDSVSRRNSEANNAMKELLSSRRPSSGSVTSSYSMNSDGFGSTWGG